MAIALLVLFAIVVIPAGLILSERYWSSPKEFWFGDERFTWVPGESRGYEHGSFEYPDGTPVTDVAMIRSLQEEWLYQKRPSADP